VNDWQVLPYRPIFVPVGTATLDDQLLKVGARLKRKQLFFPALLIFQ